LKLVVRVVEELSVDLDLVIEVVSLVFVCSEVDFIGSLLSLSCSEVRLLLGSEGIDFSNQSLVVVKRFFFTISVINIGSLNSSLDILEFLDNISELLSIELSRKLNKSLDRIRLGDSFESTSDILLGNLEERVSSGCEVLKLGDDLIENVERVFISLFSGSVGVDVVSSGLVDKVFTAIEVRELLLEVSDLISKGGKLGIEAIDVVIDDFKSSVLITEVLFSVSNNSLEVSSLL
jgi:hypothetical protein